MTSKFDFDLDDPLADILSDGSNDSFFNDDILGSKKPSKKETLKSENKKDLEVSKTETIQQPKDSEVYSIVKPVENFEGVVRSGSFSKKTSSLSYGLKQEGNKPSLNKMEDIFDGLLKPKEIDQKKSNSTIFDDVLNRAQNKTNTESDLTSDFDNILKTPTKTPLKRNLLKSQSRVEQPKPQNKSLPKTADYDWLGIKPDTTTDRIVDNFEKTKRVTEIPEKLKRATETADNTRKQSIDIQSSFPSWLLGTEEQKQTKAEPEILKLPEERPKTAPKSVEPNLNMFEETVLPSILSIGEGDFAQEGASICLKQQEQQLMIALQLKAQEEKLTAMQERQNEASKIKQELTLGQNQQLTAMLERQAEHRKQMQNIIAKNQERINHKIKALIAGSAENLDEFNPDASKKTGGGDELTANEQTERKQLLQLIQTLQENHEREVDLMETSYRRQLSFIELSTTQMEERMKEETDHLIQYYKDKIIWLEGQCDWNKKNYEVNISELSERYRRESETIRSQHAEDMRIMQEQHIALIENLKNSVKQDTALIAESSSYSTDLKQLLNDVKATKDQYQCVLDSINQVKDSVFSEAERVVRIREKQVSDLLQQLSNERSSFEIERNEFRKITQLSEDRLRTMTQALEEEKHSLREKQMEFELEKVTFSKQSEFMKNLLRKQDEEIKLVKEDIEKDRCIKFERLEEEKRMLRVEREQLSDEKRGVYGLKQQVEKLKMDLEVQLEQVSEERSRMKVDRQEMAMEEQRVLTKSRDLELLTRSVLEKQSQAESRISESEYLKKKYEDKMRDMQEYSISLTHREKEIAREKIALSRERLSIHNERRELEGRQQSMQPVNNIYGNNNGGYIQVPVDTAPHVVHHDHVAGGIRDYTFGLSKNEILNNLTSNCDPAFTNINHFNNDRTEAKDFVDPKLLLLKLDIEKVLKNLKDNKQNENCDDKE